MSLSGSKVYYLVESSALPEVYHKVIKTKELLESGQALSLIHISRMKRTTVSLKKEMASATAPCAKLGT